jgi:hypothetical protein
MRRQAFARGVTSKKEKYLMTRLAIVAAVAGMFLAGPLGAEEIKSGLQPGDKLPGPFHPLNINGSSAGKKSCLV